MFSNQFTVLTVVLAVGLATVATSPASGQSSGKAEWNKLVQAAKAEGAQVVSHFTDIGLEPVFNKFKQGFGVKVEASAGRPSSVIPKLLTEQKNGQFNWDILIQPVNNVRLILEPAGGLELILPYLVLPEVKDPANWHGGLKANVPMKKLYTFFDGLTPPGTGIQINRDKVSAAEVNSWQDLLKPKWKGKFGIYLPRRIATASIALACLRPGYKTDAAWEGFVRTFFAQQPMSAPRNRAVADWLLNSPLKKALLTGFHSTAKHNATKAVSPSSETMRTI